LPAGEAGSSQSGLTDALRAAVAGTLSLAGRSARAGPAALGRERGLELLDELARRGRDAREGVTRRGAQARGELSRRGVEARGELARRLDAVERRLISIEDLLRGDESKGKPQG
jgi:hypothetical protein